MHGKNLNHFGKKKQSINKPKPYVGEIKYWMKNIFLEC
jgi:hypothetical protein